MTRRVRIRVLLRGCGGRVAESDAAMRELIEKYGRVPTYLIAEAQTCSGKERGIRVARAELCAAAKTSVRNCARRL